jgi:hypothetical protein
MKIEISIEQDDEEKMPTALQKRVAKMLAMKAGRKKPNKMDIEHAMEVEEDEDD